MGDPAMITRIMPGFGRVHAEYTRAAQTIFVFFVEVLNSCSWEQFIANGSLTFNQLHLLITVV